MRKLIFESNQWKTKNDLEMTFPSFLASESSGVAEQGREKLPHILPVTGRCWYNLSQWASYFVMQHVSNNIIIRRKIFSTRIFIHWLNWIMTIGCVKHIELLSVKETDLNIVIHSFCSSVSESLKLLRNPEHYSFLRPGGCSHIDTVDDKQNFNVTKVSLTNSLY